MNKLCILKPINLNAVCYSLGGFSAKTIVLLLYLCAAVRSFFVQWRTVLVIVVKNINNNVALCLDSKGQEVVVFGKGVGFIKPPAEVPLSKIQRTFYDLNRKFLPLLDDIPMEVIDFTSQQVALIRGKLPYETNSNLIMTLADHLAFAMTRAKKGIYTPMPSIYEMEQNYPVEVEIGRQIVSAMEKEFHIKLPKGEVQGVAMHFINASLGSPDNKQMSAEEEYETILERMTQIVEHALHLTIRRNTFNYARFATHVQYLLKRVREDSAIDSDNLQVYKSIRDEYKDVSDCVDQINEYLQHNWSINLSEEEKLYLIMHINRVISQEL